MPSGFAVIFAFPCGQAGRVMHPAWAENKPQFENGTKGIVLVRLSRAVFSRPVAKLQRPLGTSDWSLIDCTQGSRRLLWEFLG